MGIKGLMDLLDPKESKKKDDNEKAGEGSSSTSNSTTNSSTGTGGGNGTREKEKQKCFSERELKNYLGRTIAIDASMQLYQFIIQIRSISDSSDGVSQHLMNEKGEMTSHLQGFFSRTIRLMESGIKPVYVFDGKAPTMKGGELAKRRDAKAKAEDERVDAQARMDKATEEEDKEARAAAVEDLNKASKRTVSVTREHNEEAKKLLQLMGIPVVQAPCEAEAQCCEMCQKGKVYAVGTEDMDALTFGTPILLRRLTQPEKSKRPILEFKYSDVLDEDLGLGLTPEQFVDLCILCGCDYCDSIKGIGPKTALKKIREDGSLEGVLENIDRKKYPVPEFLENNLDDIRALFTNPEVTDAASIEINFGAPKEEELVEFMVKEKGFAEDRIRKGIARLHAARKTGSQKRMDSFFKPVAGSSSANKRKSGSEQSGSGTKKSKASSSSS